MIRKGFLITSVFFYNVVLAQEMPILNEIGDTIEISYQKGNDKYYDIANFYKKNEIHLIDASSQKPVKTLRLDKKFIIFKEIFYSKSVVKQIVLTSFIKTNCMKKYINFFCDSVKNDIESVCYTYNNIKVEKEVFFFKNGSPRLIQIFKLDSVGIIRDRKKFLFFSDDKYLNGIKISAEMRSDIIVEVEKLANEFYSSGQKKKEILSSDKPEKVWLIEYFDNGIIKSKSLLEFGRLSKRRVKAYFNHNFNHYTQPWLFDTYFRYKKNLWYQDGPQMEFNQMGELINSINYNFGIPKE